MRIWVLFVFFFLRAKRQYIYRSTCRGGVT